MAKCVYFESTHEIFQRFDNYEISPCVLVEQKDSLPLYEFCNVDNPEIAMWCVYGHFRTGGVECISDHYTYDEAKDFVANLPKMPLKTLSPF